MKKMYKKPQTETVKVQEKEVILTPMTLGGSGEGTEPGKAPAQMDRQA